MQVPETRYAKSGDVSIAYQTWGEGERVLTWFQGLFGNCEVEWEEPGYRYLYERFGSFARVVHFDKRGTGLSDRVDKAATLEERIDDARAVLDAEGIDRAFIGGQSEGGPLAALFAATYPERTEGLILVNTFSGRTTDPSVPAELVLAWQEAQNKRFQQLAEHWGTEESGFVPWFVPSKVGDDSYVQWTNRYMRHSCSPSMLLTLLELAGQIDVHDVLETIQVPTLVMHATGDRVVPVVAGRRLAELIAGARLVEFEGEDHGWWEGPTCDAMVDEMETFVTGTRPAPIYDRALATVLFSDIVGSTEAATRLGDARWRQLLDAHDAIASEEIQRHAGRHVKSTGDGVLARFDGPARAIACSLALRQRLSTIGLATRAGLHCGEVELRGDDIGGIAVHIASRVQSLAQPDEVLATRTVKDLVVGGPFRFADRGTHTLKGVDDEWQLFAAVG